MLNIFDTYAEKIDSFRLNFNQNMILSIIIIDIRNIIYLNGLYPRIKLTSKYEQYHIKLCYIENFVIHNKVSSGKNNKLLNLDEPINNHNLNNSEINELKYIQRQKEYLEK